MAQFWRSATLPRRRSGVQRLAQSERQFREQIIQLAQLRGWAAYWTWTSIHSPAGFPDLVLARPGRNGQPGRIVFAELKTATGTVTPAQRQWLEVLGACGSCVAVVWRPRDWAEIVRVLQGEE
jgi:hypothetical protein